MKMKKISSVIIIIFVIVNFSSCAFYAPEFEDFDDFRSDFYALSRAAREYYQSSDTEGESLYLMLDDYTEWSGNSLSYAIESIKLQGFDFIQIEDDYMIIWNDETHTYGIMYTDSFSTATEEIEAWCPTVEHKKLGDGWYEIGQLNSR